MALELLASRAFILIDPVPALYEIATVAFQSAGRLKPWQVTTAKQMMLDHLDTGISVTTLAEACGLPRSHFSRMFKETTQVSPQQWLREQRLRKSKELLETSTMMLAEIALECGSYDQPHFCRTFMRSEGMTPQAWKQQAI
ncbi:helix-turn-helix domain-containing protein [Pseudomonas sp. NPDC089758]|uniref:helix-turn-helix domain-containing protein n=1 Tax=Pseudomonas sp. NPDC089758 TaxID=3364473 RepID=UPI0038213487